MARGTYSKKRTVTDKLTLKGVLAEEGDYIVYTDNDGDEQEIDILDALSVFKGKVIDLAVTVKSEGEIPEM